MSSSDDHVDRLLERVIPFRFLSQSERSALIRDITTAEFAPGDILIRQGDPDDTRVYILETGLVEIYDQSYDQSYDWSYDWS